MWPRTSTCRTSNTSRSTAPRSPSSSWGSSTSRPSPSCRGWWRRSVGAPSSRGAGRSDVSREALADTLRGAGLLDVDVHADGQAWSFRAIRGGEAEDETETVPENVEGDVRPLIAEDTEPADPLDVPAPQGLKAKLRAAAAARLPEGSRCREVAKAGLTTYRESAQGGREAVREAWAIRGRARAQGTLATRPSCAGHDSRAGTCSRSSGCTRAARTSRPTVHVVVSPTDGAGLRRRPWAACASRPGSSAGGVGGRCAGALRRRPPDHAPWRRIGSQPGRAGLRHAPSRKCDDDLVIVLRAGDRLRNRGALPRGRLAAHRDPLVDLITWDDDVRDTGSVGRHRTPAVPPLVVAGDAARRQLHRPVASPCAEPATSPSAVCATSPAPRCSWDLLLRSDLEAERVTRVARVLGSVARRDAEPATAGVRVVQQHLDRTGRPAIAEAAATSSASAGRRRPGPRSPSSSRPGTTGRCSPPACPRWRGPTTPTSTSSSSTTAATARRTTHGTPTTTPAST